VFAVAWTYDPRPLAHALTALRYSLIKQGDSIEVFHASPDKQPTRDAVVQTLLAHDDWRFAAIVIEKCKVPPWNREPLKFYPKYAGALLKFVLRGRLREETDRVLVYADTIPMDTRAKREGAVKTMKMTCAADLRHANIAHHVFSHTSASNKWLQVADYCCWAVARKWETGDARTYNQLTPRLAAFELEPLAYSARYY